MEVIPGADRFTWTSLTQLVPVKKTVRTAGGPGSGRYPAGSTGNDIGRPPRSGVNEVPAEKFHELAHLQRDKPEKAMDEAVEAIGGSDMSYSLEHLGDLTHRMSERVTLKDTAGYINVKDKVEAVLRRVDRPLQFEENFHGSLGRNYKGTDLAAHQAHVKELLSKYADEHAKLPVYNDAQRLARDAAVALGRGSYFRVRKNLEELKTHLGSVHEWVSYAHQNLKTLGGTGSGNFGHSGGAGGVGNPGGSGAGDKEHRRLIDQAQQDIDTWKSVLEAAKDKLIREGKVTADASVYDLQRVGDPNFDLAYKEFLRANKTYGEIDREHSTAGRLSTAKTELEKIGEQLSKAEVDRNTLEEKLVADLRATNPAITENIARLSDAVMLNPELATAQSRMNELADQYSTQTATVIALEKQLEIEGAPKRIETVERRAADVAEQMGVDGSIIHVVDKDPTPFTVGNQEFREAGHYDPRDGQIEINARNSYDPRMSVTQGIVAHELNHAIYQRVEIAKERERNLIDALPPEEKHRLFDTSDWEGGEIFIHGAKPEALVELRERFPASAAWASTWGEKNLEVDESRHGTVHGGDTLRDKMISENGHSDYAKSYWTPDAIRDRGSYQTAVNETLAEVTRFAVAPNSWHDSKQPEPKSSWVKLAQELRSAYPKILAQEKAMRGYHPPDASGKNYGEKGYKPKGLGGKGSGRYPKGSGRKDEAGSSEAWATKAEAAECQSGECFRNVNRYNARYGKDTDLVVHGKVTNGEGQTFDHAWIERGETAIDPTTNVKMLKEKFYQLLNAKPESKYTSTEAVRNQMRARHHGPWTAEDLKPRTLGGPGSGRYPAGSHGHSPAETIARKIHATQVDATGHAYIEHLQRVSERVSEPARQVAWLHDALEDTSETKETLLTQGITDETLRSVEVLTRRSGEVYKDFIARISTSGDPIAIEVKLADLRDNLRPGKESLRRRYEQAIDVLSKGLRTAGGPGSGRYPKGSGSESGISEVTGVDWSGTNWGGAFDTPDDFYYHVTLAPHAKKILDAQELAPGNAQFMGRAEPSDHSQGRVFLTDRNGVFFWAERVEQHAADKFDDPPAVSVIRMPKSAVLNVQTDEAGTRDAKAPAYYVDGKISLKTLGGPGSGRYPAGSGESNRLKDASGKPIVFYHGTKRAVADWKPPMEFPRGVAIRPVYLTPSSQFASIAAGWDQGSAVQGFYVHAKNVFDPEKPEHLALAKEHGVLTDMKEPGPAVYHDLGIQEMNQLYELGFDGHYEFESKESTTKNLAVYRADTQLENAIGNPRTLGGPGSGRYPKGSGGITHAVKLYHSSTENFESGKPPFDAYFGTADFANTYKDDFGAHQYEITLPKGSHVMDLDIDSPESRQFKADMTKIAYPTDPTIGTVIDQFLKGDPAAEEGFYEAWTDKSHIIAALKHTSGYHAVKYHDEYLIPKEVSAKLHGQKIRNPRTLGGPGSGNFGHSGGEGGPGNPGGSGSGDSTPVGTGDDEYGIGHNFSSADVKKQIVPQLIEAAQAVYNSWDETDTDTYANGGICHLIADEMAGKLGEHGIEVSTVSAQIGEQHVWVVAKLTDGVYEIDISPGEYETGGGYNWQKIPGVEFNKDSIIVERLDSNPMKFKDYIESW